MYYERLHFVVEALYDEPSLRLLLASTDILEYVCNLPPTIFAFRGTESSMTASQVSLIVIPAIFLALARIQGSEKYLRYCGLSASVNNISSGVEMIASVELN